MGKSLNIIVVATQSDEKDSWSRCLVCVHDVIKYGRHRDSQRKIPENPGEAQPGITVN